MNQVAAALSHTHWHMCRQSHKTINHLNYNTTVYHLNCQWYSTRSAVLVRRSRNKEYGLHVDKADCIKGRKLPTPLENFVFFRAKELWLLSPCLAAGLFGTDTTRNTDPKQWRVIAAGLAGGSVGRCGEGGGSQGRENCRSGWIPLTV